MSRKSDRRILTFPAIHPCEDVSPAALLRAVIDLCRTISKYSSKSFPSHHRIAREAIREVGILLSLFEEIQGRTFAASVVLCLSEIYFSLQKIQFLLEDCTHEGARLWILVQSKHVVEEFQVLIRSIATTVDLLPLESMDVCAEMREMIELVATQARKVKIGIDPDDKQAAMDVHLILSQFEKNIIPNMIDLKRVLARLGIRSWSKCDREIRFLEEEMEWEASKGNEKELMLLSSLVGFMNYCRGVLFDVIDGRNIENSESKHDYSKGLDCLNPEDFKCPISLELMTDPVIIATGQTYDRSSIQKWLKAGNLSCPKTGEKLKNTELIPNLALRNLIQHFLHNNGVVTVSEPGYRARNSGRTQITRSSASATEAMRMLAIFLVEKLSTGTEAERIKAAYEIRLLTKSNMLNRGCLVEAGAILPLLNQLSSNNPTTQDNAMAALLNLSKHTKGKTLIFESGGLVPILDVLRNGLKVEARQNAAATLFYLASIDEYREAIGATPGSIPALVGLLRDRTDRGKKNASVALFVLLRFPGNHQRTIAAGAIPALVSLLRSEREDTVNDSLAVLATLAERPEGSNAVLREMKLTSIVKILLSATSRTGKEHCISMLVSLCVNGGAEVVFDLRKMPSLVQSLCLILKEGTRLSRKANLLLGILRDCHKRSSLGRLLSSIREDHFIHVH